MPDKKLQDEKIDNDDNNKNTQELELSKEEKKLLRKSEKKKRFKLFWSDFKKFISKGSIIQLAIAVVIGQAFTAIVNSLVSNIIMPAINLIINTDDTAALNLKVGEVTIGFGAFISAIINFLITAFIIFVVFRFLTDTEKRIRKLAAKNMKRIKKGKDPINEEKIEELEKKTEEKATVIETTDDILKDIRMLLIATYNNTTNTNSDFSSNNQDTTKIDNNIFDLSSPLGVYINKLSEQENNKLLTLEKTENNENNNMLKKD